MGSHADRHSSLHPSNGPLHAHPRYRRNLASLSSAGHQGFLCGFSNRWSLRVRYPTSLSVSSATCSGKPELLSPLAPAGESPCEHLLPTLPSVVSLQSSPAGRTDTAEVNKCQKSGPLSRPPAPASFTHLPGHP